MGSGRNLSHDTENGISTRPISSWSISYETRNALLPYAERTHVTKPFAIFTRVPRLTEVKGRLARQVGEAGAFEFYKKNLARTIEVAKPLGAELWVDGTVDDIKWMKGVSWHQQGNGDLGQRMYDVFLHGCKILIGCDVPDVSPDYLNDALERLHTCDLTIGPVEDGGYFLIGMNRPHRELFEDITWGSSQVLTQTLEKAASISLSTSLLPELWDVDKLKNYRRWKRLQPNDKQ